MASIELALVALLEAMEPSSRSEGCVECALQRFRQGNAYVADCLHVGLSAMEREDRHALAVSVYSHGLLIGHGLARRAAEAVSRRA